MTISASCDICTKTFTEEDYTNRYFNGAPDGEVYCVTCQRKCEEKYRIELEKVSLTGIIEAEKKAISTER